MRRIVMTMTVAVLFAISGCATTQAAKTEGAKTEQKAGCEGCAGECDHKAEGKSDCPDCPEKGEKKSDAPVPGT